MSDVAQLLGVASTSKKDTDPIAAMGRRKTSPPSIPPNPQPSRALKLQQGMSREVLHLIGGKGSEQQPEGSGGLASSMPMSVPTFTGKIASSTPPADPASAVKVGTKWISKSKTARKWAWAPFSSSSRTDGALFNHWVRANVEYPDYPYARFDIHLDPVTYSDDEYKKYLQSDSWSQSETDFLLELANRFELRWPIIHDRWIEHFPSRSRDEQRKVEDLQHRYYTVAARLTQSRVSQEAAAEVQALMSSTPAASKSTASATPVIATTTSSAQAGGKSDPASKADPGGIASTDSAITSGTMENAKVAAEELLMETAAARSLASCEPDHQPLIQNLGTGSTNKTFDLEYEAKRRAHMEALWSRSKETEFEEAELRKELKQVEAQLRRLKKSGGHILAAKSNIPGGTAAVTGISSASSSRNPSRSVSPMPGATTLEISQTALDDAFLSTAPTPMPQNPYLQSGRLAPPATGGSAGLNKTLLTRMDAVLEELKIDKTKLIATKRTCDLYDAVRKDILTLLILQKSVFQKEGILQSKRLKLVKLGGSIRAVDEETLLGIAPPTSSPARSKSKGGGKARPGSTTTSSSKGKGTGGKVAKPNESTSSSKPGGAAEAASKNAGTASAPSTGKQARKPSAKRKRKPEAKSPAAASAAGGMTAASSKPADEGRPSTAKKRARKTG